MCVCVWGGGGGGGGGGVLSPREIWFRLAEHETRHIYRLRHSYGDAINDRSMHVTDWINHCS